MTEVSVPRSMITKSSAIDSDEVTPAARSKSDRWATDTSRPLHQVWGRTAAPSVRQVTSAVSRQQPEWHNQEQNHWREQSPREQPQRYTDPSLLPTGPGSDESQPGKRFFVSFDMPFFPIWFLGIRHNRHPNIIPHKGHSSYVAPPTPQNHRQPAEHPENNADTTET